MKVWLSRLTTVLLIAVLAFVLFLGYGLINNRWYHVLAVDGGSMEPSLNYGDLLVVSKPPAELKPGMVVTLNVDGQLVTHRVVSANPLVTKGDANETVDKWRPEQVQVVGLVRFSIPRLGRVMQRLHVAQMDATAAYMSSRASASLSIGTGTWEELGATDLELSPGCSQAVRPSTLLPGSVSFPIASQDASGKLTLDFGEVNPVYSNDSPDVFRIKNLGSADVELNVVATEGFEGFVGGIELGSGNPSETLPAGDEQPVTVKLAIPQDAAPGDHTGIIRVSTSDASFSTDIPVLVTVLGMGGEDRSVPAQPDPSPPTLSPGDSKAVRLSGDDGQTTSFTIASVRAGTLELDFGEVIVGDGVEPDDVFAISNDGPQDLPLDIEAKGGIKPFVDRIRLGGEALPAVLLAGGESSVAIDLEIPADAAPGDYSGTIRVSSDDASFSVDIPVTLTIISKPEETVPVAEEPIVQPSEPADSEPAQPAADQLAGQSGDATVTPPAPDDPQGSGTDTSGGTADPPSGGSDASGDDTPPGDPPQSDPGSSEGDSSPPADAGSG